MSSVQAILAFFLVKARQDAQCFGSLQRCSNKKKGYVSSHKRTSSLVSVHVLPILYSDSYNQRKYTLMLNLLLPNQ